MVHVQVDVLLSRLNHDLALGAEPLVHALEQRHLVLDHQVVEFNELQEALQLHAGKVHVIGDALKVPFDEVAAEVGHEHVPGGGGELVPGDDLVPLAGRGHVPGHVVQPDAEQIFDVVLVGQADQGDDRGVVQEDLSGVQVFEKVLEHRLAGRRLPQDDAGLLALGPVGIHEHDLKDVGTGAQDEAVGGILHAAHHQAHVGHEALGVQVGNFVDHGTRVVHQGLLARRRSFRGGGQRLVITRRLHPDLGSKQNPVICLQG